MSYRIILKSAVLFTLGVLFFLMLDTLQGNRGVHIVDSEAFLLGIVDPKIWLPITCGCCALLFGFLVPCLDKKLGNQANIYNLESTSVVRCLALFVGINHATAKLDFTSPSQLCCSLIAMSLGLWYFFDRSLNGLLLAIIGFFGSYFASFILIYFDYYQFHDPNIPIWLPSIIFSGIITVGLIGRHLARYELSKVKME